MPKQTFYNLSVDKQNKIIDASKKEFSENNFYDASINKIIKVAGISRGSFYQYFENKEDLFIYLLEQSMHIVLEEILKKVKDKKCDIFELYLLVFDVVTEENFNESYRDFLVTTISNMNIKLMNHLSKFALHEDCKSNLGEIIKIVNFDNVGLNSMEDFVNLNNILINLIMYHLGFFFNKINQLENPRESLFKQFELIKYGVIKS